MERAGVGMHGSIECRHPRPVGQTLRYGELTADAAKIKLAQEPAIKTPDKFTFIGKPMPRVDVVHKIDGSAKFGIDAQLPGMVFAAINACPVPGGKLKSVDDSALAGAPGVLQMVKLDNAVAVVAEGSYWRAKQALARLQPEWDAAKRPPSTATNSPRSFTPP
jgi:isoquinoline 1-oxidoreductase beta subunit